MDLLPYELVEIIYLCLPQTEWWRLALINKDCYRVLCSIRTVCPDNLALVEACKERRIEDIKYSLREPRYNIVTALKASVKKGQIEVYNYLSSYGEKLGLTRRPAHYVEVHYQAGISLDLTNYQEFFDNALIAVCRRGDEELLDALLSLDGSHDIDNVGGAMEIALKKGYDDIYEKLVKHFRMEFLCTGDDMYRCLRNFKDLCRKRDIDGICKQIPSLLYSPFPILGKGGYTDIVCKLIDRKVANSAEVFMGCISGAIIGGQYDMFKLLIEMGYPISKTCLKHCLIRQCTELLALALKNYGEPLDGRLFTMACSSGNLDNVKIVIEYYKPTMKDLSVGREYAFETRNLALVSYLDEIEAPLYDISSLFSDGS